MGQVRGVSSLFSLKQCLLLLRSVCSSASSSVSTVSSATTSSSSHLDALHDLLQKKDETGRKGLFPSCLDAVSSEDESESNRLTYSRFTLLFSLPSVTDPSSRADDEISEISLLGYCKRLKGRRWRGRVNNKRGRRERKLSRPSSSFGKVAQNFFDFSFWCLLVGQFFLS